MTFDPEVYALRCGHRWSEGGVIRWCPAVVVARPFGKALRMAADLGWWRGRRGGLFVNRCPQHRPGVHRPRGVAPSSDE